MLSTYTLPDHPQTHAMPTRVTHQTQRCNLSSQTIRIVRCQVTTPGVSMALHPAHNCYPFHTTKTLTFSLPTDKLPGSPPSLCLHNKPRG
nr:MAG TPA: hypothetical protein [Bacteriophage sp.]